MKRFFLILVLGLMVGNIYAIQPARKPFLHIIIDGKSAKIGDVITVTSGQKISMTIDLEGGRRDFCKFPDTYADIAGKAQILSRGDDGLTYTLDGVRSEWRVKSQEFKFESDGLMKITAEPNKNTAEINVPGTAFSQSFVKATVKIIWQFNQEGKSTQEENVAEGTVYFKLAGSSDEWFSSKNIRANGIKNEAIQEKLNQVQADCDTIVKNFHRLNFAAVQRSIRNVQASVINLKATFDEVKKNNPAYQTKITFVGLPSDDPYSDIEAFNSVKNNWAGLSALTSDLNTDVAKLPAEGNNESKKNLLGLIERYNDWYAKLPEADLVNLTDYIPQIKADSIKLAPNLISIATSKTIPDYSQTLDDFKAFLDKRSSQVNNETQLVNSVQSRLPAVRLFDGMLRSYFSSIVWAEWQSTRGL